MGDQLVLSSWYLPWPGGVISVLVTCNLIKYSRTRGWKTTWNACRNTICVALGALLKEEIGDDPACVILVWELIGKPVGDLAEGIVVEPLGEPIVNCLGFKMVIDLGFQTVI